MQTYYTDKAASWYKNNTADGKVITVWPGMRRVSPLSSLGSDCCLTGSNLHAMRALKHPRWEDYTYRNEEGSSNSLYFLGDGMTANEKEANGDRTWYLRDGWLDVPPGTLLACDLARRGLTRTLQSPRTRGLCLPTRSR